MKRGMGLQELVTELERQTREKRDVILRSDAIEMILQNAEMPIAPSQEEVGHTSAIDALLSTVEMPDVIPGPQIPHLRLDSKDVTGIGKVAHEQLGVRLKIPARYYRRMLENAPELLTDNVNHWLQSHLERRMVRILDGRARAFVSDRYYPIDSIDLFAAVLPVIKETSCAVASCDLTERHFYLKIVSPQLKDDISKGDVVQAGLVISNSEVGCGAVKVQPMILRLVCMNGLIVPDKNINKYHIGKANGSTDADGGAVEFFRDETKKASDTAFLMKVQDTVRGSMDKDLFNLEVERIRAAEKNEIQAPVSGVIEKVGKKYDLSEGETGSILEELIQTSELNQWGMVNAVTAHSGKVESYERATDLERIGGEILTMGVQDWTSLAA